MRKHLIAVLISTVFLTCKTTFAQIINQKLSNTDQVDLLLSDTTDYEAYLLGGINNGVYGKRLRNILSTIIAKDSIQTIFLSCGMRDEWLILQFQNGVNVKKLLNRNAYKEFRNTYNYILKDDLLKSMNYKSISTNLYFFEQTEILQAIFVKNKLPQAICDLNNLSDSLVDIYGDSICIFPNEIAKIRRKLQKYELILKKSDPVDCEYYNLIFDELIEGQHILYNYRTSRGIYNYRTHKALGRIQAYVGTGKAFDKCIIIADGGQLRRGDATIFSNNKIADSTVLTYADDLALKTCSIIYFLDFLGEKNKFIYSSDYEVLKNHSLGKATLFKAGFEGSQLKGDYDYMILIK